MGKTKINLAFRDVNQQVTRTPASVTVCYLFIYVWLPMQELVWGLLVCGASHGALLENQRVKLAD